MSDVIYKEMDECLHYHVDGFRCENCGAELRWVVPVEIDYEAAEHRLVKRFGLGTDDRSDLSTDVRAVVDAALGIGGDDAE